MKKIYAIKDLETGYYYAGQNPEWINIPKWNPLVHLAHFFYTVEEAEKELENQGEGIYTIVHIHVKG